MLDSHDAARDVRRNWLNAMVAVSLSGLMAVTGYNYFSENNNAEESQDGASAQPEINKQRDEALARIFNEHKTPDKIQELVRSIVQANAQCTDMREVEGISHEELLLFFDECNNVNNAISMLPTGP